MIGMTEISTWAVVAAVGSCLLAALDALAAAPPAAFCEGSGAISLN